MKKIFIFICLCINFNLSYAVVINIPDDYLTIQEGINASNPFDTVLVDTGEYVENIDFNGRNITVASLYLTTQDTTYISQTIINGNQNGSVVTFQNGENEYATLCGFTLTNGLVFNSSGGGIFCDDSSPTIKDLIITNNLEDSASFYSYGGGVYCDSSSPTFANITISNNSAHKGGGICCWNSSPDLEHLIIRNNSASEGGGIHCKYHSSPDLNYLEITDNNSEVGGGLWLDWDSSPCLENVTITNNTTTGNGGGIYCNESSPSIVSSIVSNNNGNYGIYSKYSTPLIIYSDLWENENGNCYGCSLGIGCIEENPLFVDFTNGNYHLSWLNFPIADSTKSPCIDTGYPFSPPDPDGTPADMGAYYFNQNIVAIDKPELFKECFLLNYPNPFNTNTIIKYAIPIPTRVKISIFNLKGQLVITLIDEYKNTGTYSINWEGKELNSGVYFYKMETTYKSIVKKVTIIR